MTFQLQYCDSAASNIASMCKLSRTFRGERASIFCAGLDRFVANAACALLWRDYSIPFREEENDTRPARQLCSLCLNWMRRLWTLFDGEQKNRECWRKFDWEGWTDRKRSFSRHHQLPSHFGIRDTSATHTHPPITSNCRVGGNLWHPRSKDLHTQVCKRTSFHASWRNTHARDFSKVSSGRLVREPVSHLKEQIPFCAFIHIRSQKLAVPSS